MIQSGKIDILVNQRVDFFQREQQQYEPSPYDIAEKAHKDSKLGLPFRNDREIRKFNKICVYKFENVGQNG